MRQIPLEGQILRGMAAAALAVALSVAPSARAPRKSVKPAPKPAAAHAAVTLDGVAYTEAHRLLESGQVELALAVFCEATAAARAKGWSLSVALLCDRSSVAPAVRELRQLKTEPVFVLFKVYKGAPCYRLCLGVVADRNAAAALARDLPTGFKEHGPFPFSLKDTCAGENLPPAPAAPGAGSAPGPVVPLTAAAVTEEQPPQETLALGANPPPPTVVPKEESAGPPPTPSAPTVVPKEEPAAPPPPPSPPTVAAKEESAAPPPTLSAPVASPVQESVAPPPSPAPAGEAGPAPLSSPPDRASTTEAQPVVPAVVPQTLAPPKPDADLQAPAKTSAAAETWFQQGLTAQGKGQNDEARRCYEQALLIEPDKPETLNNLAILHLLAGRFAEARGLLERVVAARPGYGRAHLNLAGSLWALGEKDAALEEARKACRLDVGDTSAHLTLASFLKAQGRTDEAKAEARVVLALEPGNARAKALLGEDTR